MTVEDTAPRPAAVRPAPGGERLAAWLQFPRRALLLLLAFALAWGLLFLGRGLVPGPIVDWSSSQDGAPVAELILTRATPTLTLLLLSLALALALAVGLALAGAAVYGLHRRSPAAGGVLAWLGRLLVFALAAVPPVALGVPLVFVLTFRLRLLPPSGLGPQGLLAAACLALFPALAAARAMLGRLLAEEVSVGRRWLAAPLAGLGALLLQVGGVFSAALPLELLLALPGLGSLALLGLVRRDYAVLWSAIAALTLVILVTRLIGEALLWLARLVEVVGAPAVPVTAPPHRAAPPRRAAQRGWAALALLALLIPLGLAAAGLLTDSEAATRQDLASRNSGPSAEHPWGTDRLGRDVQARVLLGGAATLGLAAAAAALVWLPALAFGGLAGGLAARQGVGSESLADVFLLPADALLFVPRLLLAWLPVVFMEPGVTSLLAGAALALWPRAAQFAAALFAPGRRGPRVWAGLLAVFAGTLFLALWLVVALDFLGLGLPPPAPTLGGMLNEAMTTLGAAPWELAPAVGLAWSASFAALVITDALLGALAGRTALARLNM